MRNYILTDVLCFKFSLPYAYHLLYETPFSQYMIQVFSCNVSPWLTKVVRLKRSTMSLFDWLLSRDPVECD